MLNLNGEKDSRTIAWDLCIESRINERYHQLRRKSLHTQDLVWRLICISASVFTMVSSLYRMPKLAIVCALVSIVVGFVQIALQHNLKAEIHNALAIRFLKHAQEFENVFNLSDFSHLESFQTAFNETEQYEAAAEGHPHVKTLEYAQEYVESAIGEVCQ